jgi:lipooligosaccharide transport system permease protein
VTALFVRGARVTERNATVYWRLWYMFVSGFFEPLFFLLSIGIGVGELVGGVTVGGRSVDYESFVAPGMMATAAMNGAVFDATFSVFFKLKFMKTYDSMVATPLTTTQIVTGELLWSTFRCGAYSIAFLVIAALLGYVESWWSLLAVPVALLIGAAFASLGVCLTSFLRGWRDFDFINIALIPLFLFSATFYPLSVYPRALEVLVQVSPLYHGVALTRALFFGELGWGLLSHVAVLAVITLLAGRAAARRFERLLVH